MRGGTAAPPAARATQGVRHVRRLQACGTRHPDQRPARASAALQLPVAGHASTHGAPFTHLQQLPVLRIGHAPQNLPYKRQVVVREADAEGLVGQHVLKGLSHVLLLGRAAGLDVIYVMLQVRALSKGWATCSCRRRVGRAGVPRAQRRAGWRCYGCGQGAVQRCAARS